MTAKSKIRYSVRVSWGGYSMDGAIYDRITSGYYETMAVSEKQAINNVRFRCDLPSYPHDMGQGNTLEYMFDARIMKPGQSHKDIWSDEPREENKKKHQDVPMTLEDDIRRTVASDPAGFSEISHDDAVLYIANGVYSARAIKEYIEAGIGPVLAGNMELGL